MNQLSPIVQQQAIELIAQGIPQKDIAKELDISAKSVSRIKDRDIEAIEELAKVYVAEAIEPIKENNRIQLQLSNEISSLLYSTSSQKEWNRLKQLSKKMDMIGLTAKDILTIADKKEFRALQIMGIAPSNTMGTVINNWHNKTQINVLSSEALAFADAKVSGLVVQDAEYQGTEPSNDGGSQ